MIIVCVAVVVTTIGYIGWKLTARGAYESAEYSVLVVESPFEIREYPDLLLAATAMQFDSQGADGSFMRLFEYISGENNGRQKVAMTIPVFMESEAEDAQGQMGFVIPREIPEQRVPEPSNKDVKVCKRLGGRFAVIRFAGQMDSESVAQAEHKLRNWIYESGLIGKGASEYAGYDPPWTPGPWRRNEVLIRLQ